MGRGRLPVAVLCCGVLLGCTPAPGGEPTPSITPGIPTPSENEFERQQRMDFEAAETAYRTFQDSFHATMRNGGSLQPTAAMKANGSGEYLRSYSEVLEGAKRSKYREVGVARAVYIDRTNHEEDKVELTVCEDTTDISVMDRDDRVVGRGEIRMVVVDAARVDGAWLLTDLNGRRVTRCDASQSGSR